MPRYRFPSPAGQPTVQANAGVDRRVSADAYPSELEAGFPRVVQAIQALWGYKELNDYFRKLMIDDRGNRIGFPPEAWEEIYLLQHIHQELMPEPEM